MHFSITSQMLSVMPEILGCWTNHSYRLHHFVYLYCKLQWGVFIFIFLSQKEAILSGFPEIVHYFTVNPANPQGYLKVTVHADPPARNKVFDSITFSAAMIPSCLRKVLCHRSKFLRQGIESKTECNTAEGVLRWSSIQYTAGVLHLVIVIVCRKYLRDVTLLMLSDCQMMYRMQTLCDSALVVRVAA